MKRGWFLLLCVSLGLNAAFLFVMLTGHTPGREPAHSHCDDPARFLDRMMESHWPDGRPGQPPGDGQAPPGSCPEGIGPRGPGRGGRGFPPGEMTDSLLAMRLHHLGRLLDLDEEQRMELEAVMSEHFPQLLSARKSVFDKRREIFETIGRDELDAGRVRSLVRELSEAQARLDSIMAESILLETERLTPGQREAYFRALPWHRQGPGQSDRRGRGRN